MLTLSQTGLKRLDVVCGSDGSIYLHTGDRVLFPKVQTGAKDSKPLACSLFFGNKEFRTEKELALLTTEAELKEITNAGLGWEAISSGKSGATLDKIIDGFSERFACWKSPVEESSFVLLRPPPGPGGWMVQRKIKQNMNQVHLSPEVGMRFLGHLSADMRSSVPTGPVSSFHSVSDNFLSTQFDVSMWDVPWEFAIPSPMVAHSAQCFRGKPVEGTIFFPP
jgi:hypothetical protein